VKISKEATVPAARRTDGGPTRVLWLIKGLDPGGAELLLSMLAEVRDRDNFEYEAAYLLPWKTGLVGSLEDAGVPVHCLRGGREWDLRWAMRLRRLVRERRYDVVHIHSPYVAGIARMALRAMPASVRPKIVYTEHLPWWGYVRPTRMLNRLTYRLDDANLAVSRIVTDSIPPGIRERVHVVVQGIFPERVRDQLRFRDEVRTELGIGPDELVVGTVAHFRPQKGYPVLLEAARRVLDLGLQVRFVAVGRGPQEDELRAIHARLGLGDRFLFMGFREDATRVMAGFDLFVLASHTEGLPLALMEALAIGMPVVATAVGGIPEGLKDGVEGLLVPASRPDLLAHAIETLARDPELRARMSHAAADRGRAFDIRGSAQTMEEIYRAVVSQ
jgi:glycosyltransferase involved in cell wall biosynthesis